MSSDTNVSPSYAPTHAICFLKLQKIKIAHSYKKEQLRTSIGYLPGTLRARADGFLMPPHLCPHSSAQPRPLSQWRCASTLRFRATSLPSKHQSPTPASSMRRRWVTRLSLFNTGLPQYQPSRNSHKTSTKPDTMSFPSPPIEYRIVYGKIFLYDYTRLSLGLDSTSLNVRRT